MPKIEIEFSDKVKVAHVQLIHTTAHEELARIEKMVSATREILESAVPFQKDGAKHLMRAYVNVGEIENAASRIQATMNHAGCVLDIDFYNADLEDGEEIDDPS